MRMNAYIHIRFALIHIVHDHTCAHSLYEMLCSDSHHSYSLRDTSLIDENAKAKIMVTVILAHSWARNDWPLFLPPQLNHD